MQIIFMEKTYECENQIAAVEAVIAEINQLIANSEQKLSCLEIDDVEVYDNHREYIISQLETINTILVKVKPLAELLTDVFLSLQEYIARAVPEIARIADEFSLGTEQGTWQDLAQLLEGLQYMLDTLTVIDTNKKLCYNAQQYGEIRKNLIEQIEILRQAMEDQDRVSLGDILRYRIVPLLENLNGEINRNEH